jgi:hypothetical protein
MALQNLTTQGAATASTGMFLIYSLNLKETAGATAVFQLKDDTGGAIKREWNLAANETVEITWEHPLRTGVLGGAGFQGVILSGAIKWSAGGTTDAGR